MTKIITLLTITSFVVLAGCASDPASVNVNAGITETQKGNENTEVVVANANDNANLNSNTNDFVNENANTNSEIESNKVDTSDWNKFTFDELGISLLLPFESSEIEAHYNVCGEDIVCSSDGYSYTAIVTREENYIIFGSVSEVWTPKREGSISYLHDFKTINGEVFINRYGDKTGWKISPIEEVSLSNNTQAYIFDPIQDYYAGSEMYNISDIEPAYAAVIPLGSETDFKAAMMYVEKKDMSLEELITALESIEFTH